jgi:putative Mn2+ efflux pump MntP
VSRSLRFFAVAAIVYWLGDAAKRFIEDYLGWLTIAFVILLVLGFWIAGKGARRAAREGE